jgi:hypothetical protein
MSDCGEQCDHDGIEWHWTDEQAFADAILAAIPAATDEGLRTALDAEMHVAEVREKGIDGRPSDERFWAGYREGLGFARELLVVAAVR